MCEVLAAYRRGAPWPVAEQGRERHARAGLLGGHLTRAVSQSCSARKKVGFGYWWPEVPFWEVTREYGVVFTGEGKLVRKATE